MTPYIISRIKKLHVLMLLILIFLVFAPQPAYSSNADDLFPDLSNRVTYYDVKEWTGIDKIVKDLSTDNFSNLKKLDIKNIFPPKSSYQDLFAVLKVPLRLESSSFLALRSFSSSFAVYSGTKKIYEYPSSKRQNGRAMGYAYHMIRLPGSTENSRIIIYFKSVFSQYGSVITDMRADSGEEVSSHISQTINSVVRGETYYVILGGIFLFMGLVLILFFMSKQENEFAFVYLGLSSILMGIWIMFENNIINVYIQNKHLTFIIGAIALQLMALGFLGFVNELFVEKKSVFSKCLIYLITANILITFLLDVSGILSLYLTIRVFHLLLVLTILNIIVEVKRASSRGSIEAKLYLVGFFVLASCGIIDVINMYYLHLFSPNFHISAWAMLAFILLLIIILYWGIENINHQIRQYNKEIKLKNSELQKAWEETKQSKDEVTELNLNLEKKVHQRTKQLEDANEELTAINEELNETMSALKKAQVQLVQSEKMASLGNLVAGVAHEINTPLATIKSNIQMGELLLGTVDCTDAASFEEYRDNSDSMNRISKDALERIIDIVKNLRTFARLDEAEVKEADIHQGLDNTLALVRNQMNGKIELIKDYGDLPAVICYPGQLNQVFLNLIVNAIHAMEGLDRPAVLRIKTGHANGKVSIVFSDNGHGISSKNLPKIFDPGFTTKGVGIGTGLGLSISYNIIQKHKGSITVESHENIGTKFTIELPVNMN